MAECPCCGQTLPPAGPDGLLIRGKRRLLYERVLRAGKHGVDTRTLFDAMYGDDPNGGPQSYNVVAVQVCHLNKSLKPFYQQVRGGRSGHGAYTEYKLVQLPNQ